MDKNQNENLNQNKNTSENLDNRKIQGFDTNNIVVVGCGGAGNNMVNKLYNMGVESAETIAVNTDEKHLDKINANKKILIGSDITDGYGTGGDTEIGKEAAVNAKSTLGEAIGNADLVFVIAGLGGGTGTSVAPIVSSISRDLRATTVGIVSIPFRSEPTRVKRAKKGFSEMKKETDSLVLLDNEKLSEYVPALPIGKAFSVMDQIICETIKGISDAITQPSIMNIDYADLETVLDEGGESVMLIGDTKDYDNNVDLVDKTLEHPLMDTDYKNAKGGIIHVTCGSNISLDDINEIADQISDHTKPDADIILGTSVDESYEDKVKIIAILTGVEFENIFNKSENNSDDDSFDSIKSDVLNDNDVDKIE